MPHREHAIHNEEVCSLLLKQKAFPDWVVTTAFYSALHYAEDLIFPLKEGDSSYDNISEYKVTLDYSKRISKHDLRLELIKKKLSGIYNEYRWLYEKSHKARYVTYKIDPEAANLAKRYLEKIRNFKKS
ncbi:hypothetical protein [Leptospira sp. id769339]|uniref:hypothetical protein n=1 Tax=Leptospira sp. id769339 TaxID=2864221 RepID=UPI00214CDD33|nr:hypothetical protein [Leptospira sp. id769339]MCR1795356.1 hypothetical protein [Leptospira sp. id769339]